MARKTKRSQGDVPYPVSEYVTQLADLDIWDNMFLESVWGFPTIYNFPPDTPPSLVLDVGCSTGWWIIHMARRWENTIFVGFDIAEIQPRLAELEHYKDISGRITWVNGNFLDVFPFPDEHFDYVRVCRAGLAIPEDEWQWFLEQGVWRVMKTGGVLEIIEEDLIFPTPTLPGITTDHSNSGIQSPTRLNSQSSLNLHSSASSGGSSMDNFHGLSPNMNPDTTISDDRSSKSKKRSRLSSFKSAITPLTKDPHINGSSTTMSDGCITDGGGIMDLADHPQNHSKLKAAWDSMLNSVEVLHLYTVPLPANTPLEYGIWDDDDLLYSQSRTRSNSLVPPPTPPPPPPPININPENLINHPIITDLPRLRAMNFQSLAGMHLHYTVEFIKSCKEAIRKEHRKLFPVEDGGRASANMRRVQRMAACDVMGMVYQAAKPEPFDVEWQDWVCDMEDRMRLRQRLPHHMAWNEPRTPYGKPIWCHWRKLIDQMLAGDNKSVFDHPPNPSDICRSVKAYTAWKGSKHVPVV